MVVVLVDEPDPENSRPRLCRIVVFTCFSFHFGE